DDLYNSINRGVDILKTEPEMLVYLYSFGNMHQVKLNFAFDKIPEEFFSQPEINVIDYGCGQAIGTMCYADFLKSKNYNQQIKSVTLIEPSEICIKRAALHTSVFLPDAKIVTVNKTFDELAEEDINCNEDVPTLHILSNVLDLEFNISKFTKLVKGRLKGYNQFLCVGPYFGYEKKDCRMEVFAKLVGGDISFSKAFGKGLFVEGKNWTCQVVVVSVGELEEDLSTEVTEEDIKNGVEDKFGVVYSRDGKRLLKSKNFDLVEYQVCAGTKVICDEAFDSNNSLKVITLPNSVTMIGDSTFNRCVVLHQINIPNSVASIGDWAFHYCKSLSQIIIPDSVTSIGYSSFANCISLQQISLPKSLTIIEPDVFYGCVSLRQIIIPDSVSSIGNYAFYNCKSLQHFTLPNSVTILGNNPFVGCENIIFESLTSSFEEIDEFIVDNQHNLISYIGNERNVEIPDGITSIGASVFSHCNFIRKISVPDSVTIIKEKAFLNCESLRYINIPDSVLSIGKSAFCGCKSLQQITI
ncbi:MAG: leucine-rich repeat domain-containing protein, partial [Alphaproteobacteria bacterium]|nr:leucine-rich repeat domain-containing protein [Alphaproteobacteria bacterium]